MSMQIGKGGAVSKAQPLDQNVTTDTEPLARPIPLLRPIELGWDLPLDYLGSLREPVEAIAEKTSASIEIAFQSALATAALATQHISDVETLSGSSPLSLFLLTIAASGERKSSCDKLAISPIQDWEEERDLQYQADRADYEFEKDQFDALRRKAARSEADGVVDAGTPQAPVPPVVPRKLLGDITFEGLLRHFDEGDPSIGIFADEGGQFFGGHGMGRDNQLKTAAGLSKLWDAAPLNRTRAGSPQATYRHRRGSLHLMIQPGVAETVLSNQILRDQGLLSRMLIAWPRSRIGQRLIVLSDEQVERLTKADMSLRSYHQRISMLLNQTERSNSENLELRPRTLKLSAEAKNLLICFANQVETEQGPSQRLASISGFASKAAEQSARIAAILSVYADPDCVEVDLAGMERGVQIASWYIGEAQRLLDAGPGNEHLEKAQKLLGWLQQNYRDRAFNTREVQRGGPPSLRSATTIRALLKILESHHQIKRCNGPTSVNGTRTKETWELSPYV